ncbi:MAG: DUF4435 domain-containing protein [Tannerellaceae bacterium]|jgi:hypothetical protein|nr:DUF4435 domain-containing protein [Tannerellaceae bacterium]
MRNDKSLRGNVNAIDKINDIRLSLNSQAGNSLVWILVEGEDDCKIYPKFVKEEKCKVEYVNGGKIQLEKALQVLTSISNQVIGIRDADFSHIEKKYSQIKNLFYTDFHDIEMTMLNFNTVRSNLFLEYGIKEGSDVWNKILLEASFLAYIRWFSEQGIHEFLFKGLKLGSVVDLQKDEVLLKKRELIDELNRRSTNKKVSLSFEMISDFIDKNKTDDFLNLCNGHDVTSLFALFLGKKATVNEFCRHLRLSFQLKDFAKTKLYSDIYSWQTTNGFDILRIVA